MKTNVMELLTMDEKMLLLEALFSQNYAKEIVAAAIADLENRAADYFSKEKYKGLCSLYDRIADLS